MPIQSEGLNMKQRLALVNNPHLSVAIWGKFAPGVADCGTGEIPHFASLHSE
jgi:hypothetical protein